MMMMLEAGGLPILTDGLRVPDADNPKGYYELEAVKQLAQDQSWISQARGKAVKVVSALLEHLPPSEIYRVIFMRRDMREILASQQAMLVRRGHAAEPESDERIARLSREHVDHVLRWLRMQSNIASLEVSYNDLLADPCPAAQRVARFIDAGLDPQQMASAVDPTLYRQRGTAV